MILFSDEPIKEESPINDKLKFDQFDICKVLEKGEKLLGSAGDEFDFDEDISGERSA